MHVTVHDEPPAVAGRVVLVTFDGVSDRHLELERGSNGRFRFLVRDDSFVDVGGWFDPREETSFDIVIAANTANNAFELSSVGGLETSQVLSEPDDQGHAKFVVIEPAAADDGAAAQIGISVEVEPGPPLAFCNDLLDAPRHDSSGVRQERSAVGYRR